MNLPLKDYYIVVTRYGDVGFITRERYVSNVFVVKSFRNLTQSDGWGSYVHEDLGILIKKLVETKSFKVYQFDCRVKALAFVAEQIKKEK